MFFSRNISRLVQEDLARIMGACQVLGTGMCLGVPSMIGKSKKDIFVFIKDRIWKEINSWRGRHLSKERNGVIIKSVIQAIQSYIMSVFIIPDVIVNDIEKMLNSFWWVGSNNNKGIRWLAWNKLTCSKKEGGIGLRDFKDSNMAMVVKQGWHMMTNRRSWFLRSSKQGIILDPLFLKIILVTI